MADYLNPEDIAAQSGIARQQKLAEMLFAQGAQQPQGQVVSGQYVKASPLQFMANLANQYAGMKTNEAADKAQINLAQKIRQQEFNELQNYQKIKNGIPAQPATPEKYTELAGPYDKQNKMPLAYMEAKPAIPAVAGNPADANMYAANAYGAALRAHGMKKLTEGPKWEKAEMPQPDGSVKHGWVDYNSPDVKGSFVEGGTKPAYTPIEGARFQYDTGMSPPSGVPMQVAPVRQMQSSSMQNAPVQNMSPQGQAVANRPAVAPMSYQAVNQVNPATGNAVPVSAMNRPAMSPKQAGEANQAIYTEQEKDRQKSLKQLPTDINQAEQAIITVQQMIGDARIDDKGDVVYKKYDPTSKKWVEGVEPHAGFGQYVGLGVPYLSNIHGTDTASFRTLYESLKGQAFLEAFARIRGAGAITEVEGTKATQALLKLNNAQTETEFIKYAREFQENAQKGMELAKNKAGVNQNYRSPVNQPALRWNPQTNSWVQ